MCVCVLFSDDLSKLNGPVFFIMHIFKQELVKSADRHPISYIVCLKKARPKMYDQTVY